MATVVLENVGKRFKGARGERVSAVRDVNLSIGDHEFVVLVGPSGCGKSTTLRMIAGLEEIDDGTISIDGRVVNHVDPKDRDIAMVFQNYALYPHMSVYENMAFGLQLRKFPKAEIDQRVRDAAQALGLGEYLERLPKALSGGQRQRVAVGRAMVRRPKVFLFDEPLSNLDAQMRVQMRGEISQLHRRLGATMIYVTHDQVEAMTMGDRIVVMKDGVIQQVGDPMSLYHAPANRFVAGFIGSPPMNFVPGQVEWRDGATVFRAGVAASGFTFSWSEPSSTRWAAGGGRKVWLGVRPEDVVVKPPGAGESRWARLEAVVEAVEPLGSETHWLLRAGEHSLIARVHPEQPVARGQAASVWLDHRRLHWFEFEAGGRI